MKFDFNRPLININGSEMKDNTQEVFTMHKMIAQHLGQMVKFNDPVKLVEWCRQLWSTGTIDLDKSDQSKFRAAVASFETLNSYLIGQMLETFDDIKDARSKKPEEIIVESAVSQNGSDVQE